MDSLDHVVAVVGAGLAGSECAWVLAEKFGVNVHLFEMKGNSPNPAQHTPHLFSELVCSNSLKSLSPLNPAGLLKTEMESLGSLVVPTAHRCRVPAGEALAVDREKFSGGITAALRSHPRVTVREEEVVATGALGSYGAVVVATGPLTADPLAQDLMALTGSSSLYFYDAIAPIVDGDTIDMSVAFWANRALANGEPSSADSGGDYLNIPFTKGEYTGFVEALLEAPKVPFHNFEDPKFFNGCQPIETLAASGPRTLAFGPMRPSGLTDPRTGRWPYAALQLRREQVGSQALSLVGFQTRLTWTAQKEIFRTLPAMSQVEFFRLGSMHRNTYLVSPQILNRDLSLKANSKVFLAGQVMGVEGYLESASMGLWVAHMVAVRLGRFGPVEHPPAHTALGSLVRYLLETPPKDFVPMNTHWGLFDAITTGPTHGKLGKSQRRELMAQRAQQSFQEWASQMR